MFKLIIDNTVTEQETDSAFSNLLIRKYTAVYLIGILSPISPEVLEEYERRNKIDREKVLNVDSAPFYSLYIVFTYYQIAMERVRLTHTANKIPL